MQRGKSVERHFNIWFVVFDFQGITVSGIKDRLQMDYGDRVCERTINRALLLLERRCLVYSKLEHPSRRWFSNSELKIKLKS